MQSQHGPYRRPNGLGGRIYWLPPLPPTPGSHIRGQKRREIFKVAKSRSKSILRGWDLHLWGWIFALVIFFAPQGCKIDFDLDFAILGFSPGENLPISQKITTIGEDVRPAGSRSHRIRCGLVEAVASIILVRVQSLACPSLIRQLWH